MHALRLQDAHSTSCGVLSFVPALVPALDLSSDPSLNRILDLFEAYFEATNAKESFTSLSRQSGDLTL